MARRTVDGEIMRFKVYSGLRKLEKEVIDSLNDTTKLEAIYTREEAAYNKVAKDYGDYKSSKLAKDCEHDNKRYAFHKSKIQQTNIYKLTTAICQATCALAVVIVIFGCLSLIRADLFDSSKLAWLAIINTFVCFAFSFANTLLEEVVPKKKWYTKAVKAKDYKKHSDILLQYLSKLDEAYHRCFLVNGYYFYAKALDAKSANFDDWFDKAYLTGEVAPIESHWVPHKKIRNKEVEFDMADIFQWEPLNNFIVQKMREAFEAGSLELRRW